MSKATDGPAKERQALDRKLPAAVAQKRALVVELWQLVVDQARQPPPSNQSLAPRAAPGCQQLRNKLGCDGLINCEERDKRRFCNCCSSCVQSLRSKDEVPPRHACASSLLALANETAVTSLLMTACRAHLLCRQVCHHTHIHFETATRRNSDADRIFNGL